MNRRNFLKLSSASTALLATSPLAASDTFELKMAMSWIKNSPGTGATAARLAQRIEQLSGGQVKIRIFGANELVSPFEVLDAVGAGTADLGHSASFFWQGKMRASAFYTAVPFGLTPQEHMVWIYHAGGQQLWDRLYRTFNVKPFLASNTSIGMGGWFRNKIHSLQDIQGLKYRMPGLGGEVMRRLGANAISIPPPDIATSLHTGVVDAAEWLGPWSDLAMGFYKTTPYYYGPGFHEPNGAGECLVNLELWNSLPQSVQTVISTACIAEHAYSLTEIDWANPTALARLTGEFGVEVLQFPDDVLSAARQVTEEILDELSTIDEITGQIVTSYRNTRDTQIAWSEISRLPFLGARTPA